METDPYPSAFMVLSGIMVNPVNTGIIISFVVLVLLLLSSAMVSGSEVAFFSLTPANKENLKLKNTSINNKILGLLEKPNSLLATILVLNNFINVGIVILSVFITSILFDFSLTPILGFLIQVIVITFLILLFGEILPKLYANRNPLRFALFMAPIISFTSKIFKPLTYLLIYSTSFVNKRMANLKKNISIDDLSTALEITEKNIQEDRKILRGIVKFGNIEVREIMKSRVDVIATDIQTSFKELIKTIVNSGFSRIPVFEDTFDNIKGVLYVKDLLPHIHKTKFKWQSLIRPPYFVPETKKINDLLKEFQTNRIHMAIVIDEYGGSSGIITLEDILEEIVGEITDESDEEESFFKQIDPKTYLVDGKMLLNDLYKVLNLNDKTFDEVKGEADTVAGLILEIKGELPMLEELIIYKNFQFKIKSVDNRRIKEIEVKIT